MPKTRPEEAMKKNLKFARVLVDRAAMRSLETVAEIEGRTLQRQLGMLLERLATLCQENPDALRQLGFFSTFAEKKVA